MKTWNLGNTTVRSPERIAEGLRVLEGFAGRVFDESVQLAFYEALRDAGVVRGDMGESGRAISGRKWASAANQMGFAVALKSDPPVRITDAGRRLLLGEALAGETWLRQLLKVQLPPPLEPARTTRYEGFAVHPFGLTLRATTAMEDRKLEGLHREEIALYIVTALRDTDLDSAVQSCAEYRQRRQGLVGSVAKHRLFQDSLLAKAAELYGDELEGCFEELRETVRLAREHASFVDSEGFAQDLAHVCAGGKGGRTKSATKTRDLLARLIRERSDWDTLANVVADHHLSTRANTFIDYADTTVRYCRMTRLFSLRGSVMVISEDARELARELAALELPAVSEEEFSTWLWSADVPSLPLDDAGFLREDLARLTAERVSLQDQLAIAVEPQVPPPDKLPDLKLARASAGDSVAGLREELFYRRQAKCVPEILETLRDVLEGEMVGSYRPAFLEWGTWRAFLATNALACAVSATRNFKVDSDVTPSHTAKAGVSDMVFQYADHVLAVEVTLRTGPNQWSAEGEPVPRHVFDVMRQHPHKRVLGLFLAPKVDPNTANQFLNQVYWDEDLRANRGVDVVPMSLAQFMALLEAWGPALDPPRMRELLESCLDLRSESDHGPDWLERIAATITAHVRLAAAS